MLLSRRWRGGLASCVLYALLVVATAVVASAHHHPSTARSTPTTITVAGYTVNDIQSAIGHASAGDTVYFPAGSYVIDHAFTLKSDVNYKGDPSRPAVLVGQRSPALTITHGSASPLHNVTISGLQFDDLQVKLTGKPDHSSFSNITFKDCLFKNGKPDKPWSTSSYYLYLAYTTDVTVDNCTFLRNSTSTGRGVELDATWGSVIEDSYFGTTRDLEPGAPNGYFRTAINVFGWDRANKTLGSHNVVIEGNTWRRAAVGKCPGRTVCEDHGVYAWGVRDLVIANNYGDGWTNTGSGGSLKLRNSEDVFVRGNHFMTSGIKTYTHVDFDSGGKPKSTCTTADGNCVAHLYRMAVTRNRIDMPDAADGAEGIYYRRINDTTGSSAGTVCKGTGYERDLYITNNQFVAGGTIDVRCAEGAQVCVSRNAGVTPQVYPSGVRTTRCAMPDSWAQPLAGVHRGDFNDDGKPDFAQYARRPSGGFHWQMHLSAGDGYTDEDWGDGVVTSTDTEEYGVLVADFNGDGRDDIAYRAVCGPSRAACWRVHQSTGTSFMAPHDFGDGVQVDPDETFQYGFHAGDYNGDGRADIAFRGRCGNDGHHCWRVLVSQPNAGFTAHDWGNGFSPDPTTTATYGLLVGDFNGDGRDDIAYPGSCTSTACMMVSLGGQGSFTSEGWGGGFYYDNHLSPQFGMRVTDINGDGRADIGYVGLCGDSGVPRWRYHRGTATGPFSVSCATDGPH